METQKNLSRVEVPKQRDFPHKYNPRFTICRTTISLGAPTINGSTYSFPVYSPLKDIVGMKIRFCEADTPKYFTMNLLSFSDNVKTSTYPFHFFIETIEKKWDPKNTILFKVKSPPMPSILKVEFREGDQIIHPNITVPPIIDVYHIGCSDFLHEDSAFMFS